MINIKNINKKNIIPFNLSFRDLLRNTIWEYFGDDIMVYVHYPYINTFYSFGIEYNRGRFSRKLIFYLYQSNDDYYYLSIRGEMSSCIFGTDEFIIIDQIIGLRELFQKIKDTLNMNVYSLDGYDEHKTIDNILTIDKMDNSIQNLFKQIKNDYA